MWFIRLPLASFESFLAMKLEYTNRVCFEVFDSLEFRFNWCFSTSIRGELNFSSQSVLSADRFFRLPMYRWYFTVFYLLNSLIFSLQSPFLFNAIHTQTNKHTNRNHLCFNCVSSAFNFVFNYVKCFALEFLFGERVLFLWFVLYLIKWLKGEREKALDLAANSFHLRYNRYKLHKCR